MNGDVETSVLKSSNLKWIHCLGWRRTRTPEPNIDEMFGSQEGDDLKQFLSRCDYVALTIELNYSIWHIIGAGELAAMKESAYLINMTGAP